MPQITPTGPTRNGCRINWYPVRVGVVGFDSTTRKSYVPPREDLSCDHLERMLKASTQTAVDRWNAKLGNTEIFRFVADPVTDFPVNTVLVRPYLDPATPLLLGKTTTWFVDANGGHHTAIPDHKGNPYRVNQGVVSINFYALDRKFLDALHESLTIDAAKKTKDEAEAQAANKTDKNVKPVVWEAPEKKDLMAEYGALDTTINGWNYLFSVIHELGHVLGLDHTDDPTSIMYRGLNHNVALPHSQNEFDISGLDVAAVKALYQLP